MLINCGAQTYGLTYLINEKMASTIGFWWRTKDWETKIVGYL